MNLLNYDKNNQIELLELTLEKKSKKFDLVQVMEQFILYEDIFQPYMTARLLIRDQVNFVGELPVVGGEQVTIRYRTPVYNEATTLKFIVYKVGERGINNTTENIQMNQLFLCTPEAWKEANQGICSSFKGTYTNIIRDLLKEVDTKKKMDFEESVGIVDYVAPAVFPVSKSIKFCASRANSRSMSPMLFWETPTGFNFKSLKELYRATYNKYVYIEDRAVAGADRDANKTFNTAYRFEILESNDRLKQYVKNAFGADNYMVDHTNARILKVSNSYDELFGKYDIKLNKFPLNDDNKSPKPNIDYIPYTADMGHLSSFNRKASFLFMDNQSVICDIPGDSQLAVGSVIWMEIPSKVGLSLGIEEYSSGKWLLRSAKHLITKTTYTMTCELTKDAFDKDVNKG